MLKPEARVDGVRRCGRWLWPHRKPKQKPKSKRDDMNDEIPFVLAAVAMIPLLAMLAGSGTLL